MNGDILRQLLKQPYPVISPGCFDALSALLAQKTGFKCVSVSGAAATAAMLGLPDKAFLGLDDMAQLTARITGAVDIPVLVDCDAGYGNALNAAHTMRVMSKMGAACVCFQDKLVSENRLRSVEEMEGLLGAVVHARGSEDTLIMARTDALKSEGTEMALVRAHKYVAYGADIIFIDGLSEEADIKKLAKAQLNVPLKFNNTIKSAQEQKSAQQLYDCGFSLITYSASLQKAAIKAMQAVLNELLATGKTQGCLSKKISQKERSAILGEDDWDRLAQKYLAGKER